MLYVKDFVNLGDSHKRDNKMKSFLILVSIILVLLLLPVIFKDKGQPALVGPDLSELEYSEIFFENRRED